MVHYSESGRDNQKEFTLAQLAVDWHLWYLQVKIQGCLFFKEL